MTTGGDSLEYFFIVFSVKIRLDVSCESFARQRIRLDVSCESSARQSIHIKHPYFSGQRIHMKHQALFSPEKKVKKKSSVVCCK